MDEKEVINDAINKHSLVFDPEDENIKALVRYALQVGYSNGVTDGKSGMWGKP